MNRRTMQLHHAKHHATDLANLSSTLKDRRELRDVTLQDLLARFFTRPRPIRRWCVMTPALTLSHTMSWQVMGGDGDIPGGDPYAAITRDPGTFDGLKTAFDKAASAVFGGAMMLADDEGKLSLVARPLPHEAASPDSDAVELAVVSARHVARTASGDRPRTHSAKNGVHDRNTGFSVEA